MKKLNFILINGPMGSGKSTIAKLLHPKLRRTAFFGGDSIKWFISDFQRSKRDNDIVHKVVLRMCDEYLNNGISLLLAQGLYSEARVKEYKKIAKRHKCNFYFYHLQAPRKTLLDRIEKRPPSKRATKPLAKTRILRNLSNHAKLTYLDAKVINTSLMKPKEAVELILKDLRG